MPIILPSFSPLAMEVANKAISDIWDFTQTLKIYPLSEVYQIVKIDSDLTLDYAQQAAWRFIIENKRVYSFADVTKTENGFSFLRHNSGPQSQKILQIINYFESERGGLTNDYLLTILEIPQVYQNFLWFYNATDQFFIALENGNNTDLEFSSISTQNLLDQLQESSQELQDGNSSILND